MTFSHELVTLLAGAAAGTLGALLGIGGGIFLVPFLNLALGVPFPIASGISLVTVIATSTAASASEGRMKVVNLRLAMVLEVFTMTGAAAGIFLLRGLSEAALQQVFAWTMVLIALMMLARLDKRNVMKDAAVDVGWLGGRFHEHESGGEVAYRLKRTPVAFATSLLAGVISNLGVGGGIMTVPALNTWCGVPIRVAAATSSFMIGATALVTAADKFLHGEVVPELAASAVLGVLLGTQVGVRLAARSRARTHKLLLILVLAVVAAIYFLHVRVR